MCLQVVLPCCRFLLRVPQGVDTRKSEATNLKDHDFRGWDFWCVACVRVPLSSHLGQKQTWVLCKLSLHYIYIHIQIRVSVCVCVCTYVFSNTRHNNAERGREREREREIERERERECVCVHACVCVQLKHRSTGAESLVQFRLWGLGL